MAALMIPAGKLTDRWGRTRCFRLGLAIYGVGAVMSAAAPGLGVLILGNSILEGVGTALLIPPVYILTTMLYVNVESRARAVGAILSATGLVLVVLGITQASVSLALTAVLIVAGAAFLVWFFLHVRSSERRGKEPLVSTGVFRNRTANLGLITQNIQWLLLMG